MYLKSLRTTAADVLRTLDRMVAPLRPNGVYLKTLSDKLAGEPPACSPIIPPPPAFTSPPGRIQGEDLIGTPLYRAYVEQNGGLPLPVINAEVVWDDSLTRDVLSRQMGESFRGLCADQPAVFCIRSVYAAEDKEEFLVIIDRKDKLAGLVEDFVGERLRLGPLSFDCCFCLQKKGSRLHLDTVFLLHPALMNKHLMLRTLDMLFRRQFPGKTVTTREINIEVIKWIAERYQAELMNPLDGMTVSLRNFDRLVAELANARAIAPEDAELLLEAQDASLAYCLLNAALLRQQPKQSPLQHLVFLIEKIPILPQNLPELAIQGKIPVS